LIFIIVNTTSEQLRYQMKPSMADLIMNLHMNTNDNTNKASDSLQRIESLNMMHRLFNATKTLESLRRNNKYLNKHHCHVVTCKNPQSYKVLGTNIAYCKYHSKNAKMVVRLHRIHHLLKLYMRPSSKKLLRLNMILRSNNASSCLDINHGCYMLTLFI
jgi:cytochrome c